MGWFDSLVTGVENVGSAVVDAFTPSTSTNTGYTAFMNSHIGAPTSSFDNLLSKNDNNNFNIWNSLGSLGSNTADWLGNNKDTISATGSILGAYTNYKNAQAQQDYANSILQMNQDAYNRSVKDKEDQEKAMSTGFANVYNTTNTL